MSDSVSRIYNVLFLCTGNSARSIMAEAQLNAMGGGRYKAYSAGSHPKGEVHPLALEMIRRNRLPTEGLRSKDWAEFTRPEAPRIDFVITVCDKAAAEACPVWPGQPINAHWGLRDPAAAQGTKEEQLRVFLDVYMQLTRRISLFSGLDVEALDRVALRKRLNEIGESGGTLERA